MKRKQLPFSDVKVAGSIKEKRVNPDLLEERQKCVFDKDEFLVSTLDPKILELSKSYNDDLAKHPELRSDPSFFDMDREQQMKTWWERLNFCYKLNAKKYFYDVEPGPFSWSYLHLGVNPLFLHYQMFYTSIERLASDEQIAKWMPKVKSLQMVGCYA